MDIGENSVGSINVVVRDVFPNLIEIAERIGMDASRSSARSSALALFAQLPDSFLACDRFHPAALEIRPRYAAWRKPSICLSHTVIWFQLAGIGDATDCIYSARSG